MEKTIIDLLEETKKELDSQPDEIKDTIKIINDYHYDKGIIDILNYLQMQEVKYTTYTHN